MARLLRRCRNGRGEQRPANFCCSLIDVRPAIHCLNHADPRTVFDGIRDGVWRFRPAAGAAAAICLVLLFRYEAAGLFRCGWVCCC
ncbi:MAG: hypothetical protein U0992_09930 [Planctomycetaceae bacterium]